MNQFRADWVLAGTLKIGSGAPLVAKCPSDIMKNVVQIAFLPQWPLIYDCTYFCILVCPEKFCYFRKKL
jgi:hypothetical protein